MNDIKNNTTSIDSLSSVINGIEQKLLILEKNNDKLRDSISTLTKYIEKAGIKTEIFTDQLSFQLFCFSVVLAILGLISWSGIISPIKNKLKKIEEELIPKITTDNKKLIKSEISSFEDRFRELSENASEGVSWGLKSFAAFYHKEEAWTSFILMSLRHINLCFKDDVHNENSEMIINELEYILDLSMREDLYLSDFTIFTEEITNILNVVKMCDSLPKASDLAFKISINYSRSEPKPETSYDADRSEYEGPNTTPAAY